MKANEANIRNEILFTVKDLIAPYFISTVNQRYFTAPKALGLWLAII